MTKAEFVDRISGQFETKKAASEVVETMLDGITDALAGGGEISFTGFGKFSVAERGHARASTPVRASESRSPAVGCPSSPPAPG